MRGLTFFPIPDLPEIRRGDDLVDLLLSALQRADLTLAPHDVVVVSQKIVSKSEGRVVELATVTPSAQALELAQRCAKDPRLVELVLQESTRVVRCAKDVLIVRHRLGFVVANAAIDQSNLPDSEGRALLLPRDPDASAAGLRKAISARAQAEVGVLISDSFGRPWRLGVTGVCVGCAGIASIYDARGRTDRNGRALQVTQIAVADEICATATLVSGEANEGTPMVIVRGLASTYFTQPRPAADLIRPTAEDLFR
ncbi:MAG TPA: coenzyme F420-0:L-glutamate ligase [Steroidobacteraceae bacterium]|nr:coenzyme F420-0:L-glutamate ligase [Steroidobacteraceae bacterium]